MCVYCMAADEFFKDQRPPVWPIPAPYQPDVPVPTPLPATDYTGWGLDKLKELLEVLQGIKKLEEELRCPCTPAKADYIKMIKDRIQSIEDGLDICPHCKRWYVKPATKSHTRVMCLKLQLQDAEEEQARVVA